MKKTSSRPRSTSSTEPTGHGVLFGDFIVIKIVIKIFGGGPGV